MNLVIDIGNSQTKVGIFNADELVQTSCMEIFNSERLDDLQRIYPGLNRAILSSVAEVDEDLLKKLNKEYPVFVEFNHQTAVPITNLYESQATLGLDRIAAAVGSISLFPGKRLLVIDAGSAITFDLIDEKKQFLGGNISPGLEMRFKALHEFTSKLPEIAKADQWRETGKTTEEAIRAGVQNGMIFEIDGMIDLIRKDWPECQVILTGGDSFFFDKKLKNTIFVKFEITLIGLNRILEYNAEKN
ncbi:MAG: type III pantothenate kinase [Mariniphaga sp.]